MEPLKVCRICLAMDVRMYDLQKYPLEEYFEPIIGINPLSMVELPSYACYECASLVKKYYFFRERCIRGQSVLTDIVLKKGQLTQSLIKSIDRRQLNLTSNLTTSIVPEEAAQVCYHDEYEIKVEPLPVAFQELDDFKFDDAKVEDMKYEDDFAGDLGSSDNEPLILHKTTKKTKKTSKKTKKKYVKNSVSDDSNFSDELLDQLKQETSSILPDELSKPKQKRAKKVKESNVSGRRTLNTGGVVDDFIDIEQHVNVINLTMEEQLAEVSQRKQSANYLNSPFQCELCYKGFIDAQAWEHHRTRHDPASGELSCGVCRFRFRSKRTLSKHLSIHNKKFACKSCAFVSRTTTQAKQHLRWHKGVTYKCQYCDEVSTRWTSYLSHLRIKHPSEHICGACGYSFVSRLGLHMHQTMMHKHELKTEEQSESKEKGPYCAECDVQFLSEEAWKRHLVASAKHTDKDYNTSCRVCGDSFANRECLRAHHRAEHARRRPKNYGARAPKITYPAQCRHCPETVATAHEYWAHFRRAHPDQKYHVPRNHVCEVCGKSFRGNAFLVYHMRTHSDVRNYKCAQCPKAFYNRCNLQLHEKTHSDSRPYPCSLCAKAFKCKGALDRHFRCHTGVKPYQCEMCGKAFSQSNSKTLHVRTVHLKQPAPYISRSRLERRRAQAKDPQPALDYTQGKEASDYQLSLSRLERRRVQAKDSQPAVDTTHSTQEQEVADYAQLVLQRTSYK